MCEFSLKTLSLLFEFMNKKSFILFFFLFFALCSFSQNTETVPEATRPLTKWEKMFPQVRYDKKIYKTGSNWFTAAYGLGYHINSKQYNQQNLSLAYHHRFRAMYFNAGFHYSSPEFFMKRPLEKISDIHIGAGLRFEKRFFNFSFFIGPSLASSLVPKSDLVSVKHHQLGAHTELQFTFKYFYDMGIGTSIYGSFNKRYQVIGLQLHFYFSNAYVGRY